MAEFIIGTTSLAMQLFQGCLQGFALLQDARNLNEDAGFLQCMLNLEQASLNLWATRSGLIEQRLDPRLNQNLIVDILRRIEKLLTDKEKLHVRYNLDLLDEPSTSPADETNHHFVLPRSVGLGLLHLEHEQKQQVRRPLFQKLPSLGKRLRWAAFDKNGFSRLVNDLSALIGGLHNLLDKFHQDELRNDVRLMHLKLIALTEQVGDLSTYQKAFPLIDGDSSVVASTARVKQLRIELDNEPENIDSLDDRLAFLKRSGPASGNGPPALHARSLQLTDHAHPAAHRRLQRPRSIGNYDGIPVFVEWKTYDAHDKVLSNVIFRRMQKLATLLHAPSGHHHPDFRILNCMGYFEDMLNNRYCFIFKLPQEAAIDEPRTLRSLLRSASILPSLSDRIKLALDIAHALLYLHGSGWIHKGIRSENLIFFPLAGRGPYPSGNETSNLCGPYLTGFEYSRPDALGEYSENSHWQFQGDQPYDKTFLFYKHPQLLHSSAHDDSSKPTGLQRWKSSYDIYSFGIILLEIAKWRTIDKIMSSTYKFELSETTPIEDFQRVRSKLLDEDSPASCMKDVEFRAGTIFANVVRCCLNGSMDIPGDSTATGNSTTLELFFRNVVVELEKCRI